MPATTSIFLNLNLNPAYPELEHDPRVTSATDATAEISAAYNATDPLRNFTNHGVVNNVIYIQAPVIDNLENEHEVIFAFGRIYGSEWALEVYVPQNEHGTCDITSMSPISQGQVAHGLLSFNEDGNLVTISASLSHNMMFVWNNGANPSSITLEGLLAGDEDNAVTSFAHEPEDAAISVIIYNEDEQLVAGGVQVDNDSTG